MTIWNSELLTTFPLTGTFSGSYSVMADYGGIGPGPTASGTITITINVSSVVNVGYEAEQAILYGTISATGFLGNNLSYSYTGTAEDQNAIETAYGTGRTITIPWNLSWKLQTQTTIKTISASL